MRQIKYIKSKLHVFSKWSRKAYSIFVSLNKVVKIAQLNVGMCKQVILKNSCLIKEFIHVITQNISESIDDFMDLLNMELLIERTIVTQSNNAKIIPQPKQLKNNYNQCPCFVLSIHGHFNFVRHD